MTQLKHYGAVVRYSTSMCCPFGVICLLHETHVLLSFAWQELGSLRQMKPNRCKNPIEVQDLSKARSLDLVELHSSLVDLDKRVSDDTDSSMEFCTSIEAVPNSIELMRWNSNALIGKKLNLSCLDMPECKTLHNLPHTRRKVKTLKFLCLRGCINISEIPKVIGEIQDGERVSHSGNTRKMIVDDCS
ncbi:hypothetical protein Bca52824_018245 [Brassica carinata]|uniref:Disease resistance protein n=1 Tax=Brassica carinata TaxID=52824 RepID=A0A8X7VNI9_BRACI|nr:hypothetical protein Bca52824_018245 [Brassica carinata]